MSSSRKAIVLAGAITLSVLIPSTALFAQGQAGAPPGDAGHGAMIGPGTVIKNAEGAVVSFEEFKKLMGSGDYTFEPVADRKGQAAQILIRKKTREEQQAEAEGGMEITEKTIIKDAEGKTLSQEEARHRFESGAYVPVNPVVEKGQVKEITLRPATEAEQKSQRAMKATSADGRLGKPAPGFSVTDLKGRVQAATSLKGKVVVVSFWFPACKPCVEEIPALNALVAKYKGNDGVVFLAPTFNKAAEVKAFLDKHLFSYNVCPDAMKMCEAFGVSAFPANMVLDRDGRYQAILFGGRDGIGDLLDRAIKDALGGSEAGPRENAGRGGRD